MNRKIQNKGKYQKKVRLESTFEQVIANFMNVPPKNMQNRNQNVVKDVYYCLNLLPMAKKALGEVNIVMRNLGSILPRSMLTIIRKLL